MCKVLVTLYLAARLWWLSHRRYKSVCAGFLYNLLDKDLSVLEMVSVQKWHCTIRSSVFNRKLDLLNLYGVGTLLLCASCCITNESSTYLFQILGGCSAVPMDVLSKSSI